MKITLQQVKNLGMGEIISYSGDEALKKVKQNGHALQRVKEQTPEICLEAVKQNGFTLQYVKKQTPEICLEAVKQNGHALQYVDESIFKKEKVTIELTQEQLDKIKNLI